MDPISSGAIQPSIQPIPKAENAEAELTINRFGDMVSKFDLGSELREIAALDKTSQGAMVEENGLGGTFEAEA